jgi:CubicO group peptidase (beta-lactamase class C family)
MKLAVLLVASLLLPLFGADTGTERAMEVVERAVEEGAFPGAVALIGKGNRVAAQEAYGHAMLVPEVREMREDTLFDLASLTKPIATATSVMILIDRGIMRLDDPAVLFIPEFGRNGKESITIRELLTHTSGLPASEPFYLSCSSYDEVISAVCNVSLEYSPGEEYLYSDLGYMILGEIVRMVSGERLDVFARENIFGPLGMRNTTFNPQSKERCAATELCPWRGGVIVGEVHDENAYAMGGASGHAGLFSTASDLFTFAQMMLNGGQYRGKRILSTGAVRAMTREQTHGKGDYGFGWMMKSDTYSSGGDLLSESSYGHTGFTGTSIWIDPEAELVVILLTNRVHPTRDNNAHIRVRALFANAAVASLASQ